MCTNAPIQRPAKAPVLCEKRLAVHTEVRRTNYASIRRTYAPPTPVGATVWELRQWRKLGSLPNPLYFLMYTFLHDILYSSDHAFDHGVI